eukprot:159145-Rhodomonas_salina.2
MARERLIAYVERRTTTGTRSREITILSPLLVRERTQGQHPPTSWAPRMTSEQLNPGLTRPTQDWISHETKQVSPLTTTHTISGLERNRLASSSGTSQVPHRLEHIHAANAPSNCSILEPRAEYDLDIQWRAHEPRWFQRVACLPNPPSAEPQWSQQSEIGAHAENIVECWASTSREQATGDGGCVGLAFLAQNDQLSFARSEIRRDSVGQDGRALSCQRSWLCICWQISPHFAARRVRPQLEPSPSSLGLKLTSMLLVQESGSDTLVSRCGRWWHSHGHPESREA